MSTSINQQYTESVVQQIEQQRLFYSQGKTRCIENRIECLKRLHKTIKEFEQDLLIALKKELGKSHEESYLTEIGIVYNELKHHIKNLRRWSKPHYVRTPLVLFPSSSYTQCEPYGVTLILSPWNYPVLLLVNPLIAAISAGNCAIVKPSPHTPITNKVITQIIEKTFDTQHVCLINGDNQQTQFILKQQFDLIFYTGSSSFGKIVMQAAAQHLTPIVLELGGKSPCIVDNESNLEVAAKRIVWAKLLNTGQTCIAPDYILVHDSLKDQLIHLMIKYIETFYGINPLTTSFYPKIIHKEALYRLQSYLSEGDIVYGGKVNIETRQMSPTIICNIPANSAILKEEIFGPIFPILTFDNLEKAIQYINQQPKPLALYYFGKKKIGKKVIQSTSSGGACINDLLIHVSNHHLPFGGVGASGMGRYHGKYSFQTFSHERAIMASSTLFDIRLKYHPFKCFDLIKKIL